MLYCTHYGFNKLSFHLQTLLGTSVIVFPCVCGYQHSRVYFTCLKKERGSDTSYLTSSKNNVLSWMTIPSKKDDNHVMTLPICKETYMYIHIRGQLHMSKERKGQ